MNIPFEGVIVRVDDNSVALTGISPGDTYMAKRNTGWKMLTCKEAVPSPTHENGLEFGGWVIPMESPAYSYDLHECFLVLAVDWNTKSEAQ